jgi:hypothetical protein
MSKKNLKIWGEGKRHEHHKFPKKSFGTDLFDICFSCVSYSTVHEIDWEKWKIMANLLFQDSCSQIQTEKFALVHYWLLSPVQFEYCKSETAADFAQTTDEVDFHCDHINCERKVDESDHIFQMVQQPQSKPFPPSARLNSHNNKKYKYKEFRWIKYIGNTIQILSRWVWLVAKKNAISSPHQACYVRLAWSRFSWSEGYNQWH